MNGSLKKALFMSSFVALIVFAIWYFGLYEYVSLASLQSNRAYLEEAVKTNYLQAVLIFMIVC